MRRLTVGFSMFLLTLVLVCNFGCSMLKAFTVDESDSKLLFASKFDSVSDIDDWTQLGPGEWSVYLGDDGFGALEHNHNVNEDSVIFHKQYELPSTFKVSAKIKGDSNTNMYLWKGLVFYVDDLEMYVVRFSYARESDNVQCNKFAYEDGKVVRKSYSGGTLPGSIPQGEEVEIAITKDTDKVDIAINGVLVPFASPLASLPAGSHIGFYSISAASENTHFWDIEVSAL